MSFRGLAGFVLYLAACGEVTGAKLDASTPDGAPDLNDGAKSGARLKLRYVDYGNLRDVQGVRDTQRNEDCRPQEWSGGKAYCVPDAGGIVYANAACTQRLGQVYRDSACTTQSPPPGYFVDYTFTNACTTERAHLFPRATKVAATQYYFKNSDGSCGGPISSTTSDFYALGAEISMTDLVETPISAPATTGRLGQRFYESADGLRYPLSYRVHDALLGVDCFPGYRSAGATTGRCIPEDAAYAGDFRDAACTQPAVSVQSTCTKSKFAVHYGDCPYDEETYYPLGTQFTPANLYSDDGSSCAPYQPSPSDTHYTVGSPVTLATLMRIKGNGDRLKPIYFQTAEGLKVRDSMFYDDELQAECSSRTQPDGSTLCLPRSYAITTFYTDSGCTSALDLMSVYRGAATCSPPPLPSYAYRSTKDAGTCRTSYALHNVGASYTGPRFRKTSTACIPDPITTSLHYRISTAIPNSQLVSGAMAVEP
ncbi:MAG: hypothetical protein H0T46_25505 [Deltaproteobacteria bacterium]|nr:hypothetical protein [Deltaproteobacteria bacterium]